jgi:hypothetical protein
MVAGILTVAQAAYCASAQPVQQSKQPMPPGQLVREVIYNELNDHQGHGYWRYWIERHTPKETRVEQQIETANGPISQLLFINGQPLDAEKRRQEQARLDHLLNSPDEQARYRQEYAQDEKRVGRILALLPDAYLYEYEGEENGCERLRFRPNPAYPARSIEARIFHGMNGKIWINVRYKRLARLDGHVENDVNFGYGVLGRLNKGGWFQMQRTQVSPTEWKTDRLEIHMLGRALMVKSFARDTSESRGGFVPVPVGLNLAQGLSLLQQNEAQSMAQVQSRAQGSSQAGKAMGMLSTLHKSH